MKFDYKTIGTPELCAWLVAPGVCWIQTRSPRFARKLSQRADVHSMAEGYAGGYRKDRRELAPMDGVR